MQSQKVENRKPQDGPRRIFLPKARVLSGKEVDALSEKEKTFAESCRERGVWLELFCPDDACLMEEERIKLPVFCDRPEHDHSLWLEIFCPGGSCEVTEATNLP
ncbi:MAG: hypothetical protein K9N21_16500 [Deltaproteobacteria bacterium]|nr:hypothetical protein [Deltaproteobacteria bacterium]